MASRWSKAKTALGMNLCLYVPKTLEDSSAPCSYSSSSSSQTKTGISLSNAALLSPAHWALTRPSTPSSQPLKLFKSLSKKSSSKTCSICLTKMKQGGGQAIFTAECSHSFHFHCITSNVQHGNHVCPVCRATWKSLPMQGPSHQLAPAGHPVAGPRRHHHHYHHHHLPSLFPEPGTFDDDEPLAAAPATVSNHHKSASFRAVELETFPEHSAVRKSDTVDDFSVLVRLRAASAAEADRRTPVDLITVLDVSGSMAGTKLALLKRAMGFVIQNLGPRDRLSVVSFSSTSRRLFPLTRMTDSGRQEALRGVNSLVAGGGTNIAEGLRKGAKVAEERRRKNPVTSIILLSDGQDTYTISEARPDHRILLPASFRNTPVPVHAFGFGEDHDAAALHAVAEASGGTFSFVEAVSGMQDAFAQCIGGILSVVAREVRVVVAAAGARGVAIQSVRCGSYGVSVVPDRSAAHVDAGDLYADEERNFLISVRVPPSKTELLSVSCEYKEESASSSPSSSVVVRVERPENVAAIRVVAAEVERERNRLRAAEAMSKAREAAERGEFGEAAQVLERCRREVAAAAAGDGELEAELKEMGERMGSRQVYEASGRAYVLSGMSSHSWQRATARGDTRFVCSYQTPSMADMLTRSRARLFGH